MNDLSQILSLANIFKSIDGEPIYIDPTNEDNSDELFDLVNGVTSKGRAASLFSNPAIEEPFIELNGKPTIYSNPWKKWENRRLFGMFYAGNQRIPYPDDLSATAFWNPYTTSCTLFYDYTTFKGSRFTKLTGTNSYTYAQVVSNTFTMGSSVDLHVHAVFRKGYSAVADASTYFKFECSDGTTLSAIQIKWDKSNSSTPITATNMVVDKIEWYGDTVEVWARWQTATTNVLLYMGMGHGGSNVSTSEYCYVSQVTITNAAYDKCILPSQNIPSARAFPYCEYPYEWPTSGQFTIEFDVLPEFSYDAAQYQFVFDNSPGTSTIDRCIYFFYNYVADKWTFYISRLSSSDFINIAGPAITSNTQLRQWTHFKIVVDIPNNNADMYINGTQVVTGVYGTKTVTGTIAGGTLHSRLAFGRYCYANSTTHSMNGFLEDFIIKPRLDTTTAHYVAGLPYYDTNKLYGKMGALSLDKYGTIGARRVMASDGEAGSGIYDMGSNDYGNWIRFTNGLMIQWYAITTTATTSTLAGAVYYSATAVALPLPFLNTSYVVMSITKAGSQLGWGGGYNVTDVRNFVLYNWSTGNTNTIYPGFIAIGKWK